MSIDGYRIELRENNAFIARPHVHDTIVIVYDPKNISDEERLFLRTYAQPLTGGTLNHGTTLAEVRAWAQRTLPMGVEQRRKTYVLGLSAEPSARSALERFIEEHS